MYLAQANVLKQAGPVFRLDCPAGCQPTAALPPFCPPALGRIITDACALALNAVRKLEANPRGMQVVSEFRHFFDHDPAEPLPWPGLRDSGMRFARRFRAVAEALRQSGTHYRCDDCVGIRNDPPVNAILDVHAIAVPPNEVVLCPSFWSLPRFQQAGVLLHEMFHLRFDPCFIHGPCETKRTSAYCYEAFAMVIAGHAPEPLVFTKCAALRK